MGTLPLHEMNDGAIAGELQRHDRDECTFAPLAAASEDRDDDRGNDHRGQAACRTRRRLPTPEVARW